MQDPWKAGSCLVLEWASLVTTGAGCEVSCMTAGPCHGAERAPEEHWVRTGDAQQELGADVGTPEGDPEGMPGAWGGCGTAAVGSG